MDTLYTLVFNYMDKELSTGEGIKVSITRDYLTAEEVVKALATMFDSTREMTATITQCEPAWASL